MLIVLLQGERGAPAVVPTPTPAASPTPLGLLRVFPQMAVLDIQGIRLENPTTGDSFTIARDDSGNWTAPGQGGELDTQAASSIALTTAPTLRKPWKRATFPSRG